MKLRFWKKSPPPQAPVHDLVFNALAQQIDHVTFPSGWDQAECETWLIAEGYYPFGWWHTSGSCYIFESIGSSACLPVPWDVVTHGDLTPEEVRDRVTDILDDDESF